MIKNQIVEGPTFKTILQHKPLGQLFFDCATKNAANICQIDGTTDQTETYASVKRRSTRVALELLKRKVTPNDVIAFCTPNSIDTVIPILGTFYVGAQVANLEPSLSMRHTKHLISIVLPKIIFVEENSVHLIEKSLKEANVQAEIIVYGHSVKHATLAQLTEPKEGEESFRPVEVDVHQVALMFFSSGTTGLPKAICHSHYSFINMGLALYDLGLGEAVLHFTTFYWITAVIMMICSHLRGSYRVFCRSFEPELALKTIEKYKVVTAFMAPILAFKTVNVKNAANYDTSSLKVLHCGGTSIDPTNFQKVVKLFRHSKVLNVYGMSEIGYISSFEPEKDDRFIRSKSGSSGKPIYGLSLKVVDVDTNETLGPNQKGEICVKSTSIMTGYYKADSSDVFDECGFLKTGDVGYYDEDGCLYIVERIKEMFKYQSWHIVPSAIEAILNEHPAIKEAAVFGVPAGDDGEVPATWIVLEDEKNVSKEEIFDFVANKVADREKLRGGITFVKSLPKTPTGKVIRKEIKSMLAQNS